ncbi:hypothetical protein RB653_007655 [Dictyostelium firmibasis]|uniref:Minichromosome loss protein Mcl1 middle region domain-containing protein n=1 Tax=Dictyostelium firmibasis TaxID=79012 RepID=A0AAN7YP84_9MYCE
MVVKKQKKSEPIIRAKPTDLKIIDNYTNNKNHGLLKYHPEINKLLFCYPKSNQIYYQNEDKNILLNSHGDGSKIVTSIDLGVYHKCASSCEDNTINIFSTSNNSNVEVETISVTSTPNCIKFNPTQSFLAVGFLNSIKSISMRNVKEHHLIKDAHKGDVITLQYSHDGNYLASVGEDSKLKIWESGKFELFGEEPSPIHSITLDCTKETLKKIGISWRPSPLSKRGADSNNRFELTIPTYSSNTIKTIQFNSKDLQSKWKSFIFDDSDGHIKEVTNVQWSSGGEYLASTSLDCYLLIWDCGMEELSDSTLPTEPMIRYKHHCPIISFSWSPYSSNSISFFDSKGSLYQYSNFVGSDSDDIDTKLSLEDDEPNFDFDNDDFNFDDNDNSGGNNKNNNNKGGDDEEINEIKKPKRLQIGGINSTDTDNDISTTEQDNEEDNVSVRSNGNDFNDYNQESFQIGSTYQFVNNNAKTRRLNTKRYYMAYNMLGKIIKREETKGNGETSSIEIDFHDTSFHKKVVFPDPNQCLRLASLNSCGAIFATKYNQEELDENQEKQEETILKKLEEEEAIANGTSLRSSFSLSQKQLELQTKITKPKSTLTFKSFDSNNGTGDWSYIDKDGVSGVAISKNYVVSCSENGIIRIFSLGGIQLNLFSLPGDLVTMNTHGDHLAIVYHKSISGGNGTQYMNVWWIDLVNGKQFYHDTLPLSPFSKLSWIGFSDEGLLTSMDTGGMIRQLSNGWIQSVSDMTSTAPTTACTSSTFLQWIPITDLTKCDKPHSQELYTYWVIGLGKKDIYSIFCCEYPQIKQQTHNYVKIELPLLTSGSLSISNEREFVKSKFQLSSYLNYSIASNTYEESIATKQIAEIDSTIIRLFDFYAQQGHYKKCMDLCGLLHLKKSLSIVFALSNKMGLSWLSKKIVEFIENFKPLNLNPQIASSSSQLSYSQNSYSSSQSSTNAVTTTTTTTSPTLTSPKVQIDLSPPKSTQKVVNKSSNFDSDIFSTDDADQSPPKSAPVSNIVKSPKTKKIPFQIKSTSSSIVKSPDASKKRKDPTPSNQPSKISKFK